MIEKIVGEVISFIDVNETCDEILITTQSGMQFKIYHEQDCCETVEIAPSEEGDGQLVSLIGKVIEGVSVQEEANTEPPPSEYSDSWTRTKITFRTSGETVISRWIGESNGYYSESITIDEITK